MSQVLTPVEGGCLQDVEISGDAYKHTDENTNYSTLLFNPVINKGIVKLEVLNVEDLYAVGIADESVCYGRNEPPQIKGWNKIVEYHCDGDIRHIGEYFKGNSEFSTDGSRIGMELNMESNPRSLTFFINDEEQPNFIINIPNAVRIWVFSNLMSKEFMTDTNFVISVMETPASMMWNIDTIASLITKLFG
ncbi:MAG: hypothetical protein EZS28_000977 [Streblomastix strix]|uniref:B30.2/SPRY domain-containing protein n=1 Tax=Streblomastix strix TaxID=222440 RepID=A0A5J4X8L0_9EUKA|nr:MAG: hypothetical protein EZS28_000977 [Streblomastix strix]